MPASSELVIWLLLGAHTLLPAQAAEPRWPSPQEIERLRTERPMPSVKNIERQAVPGLPNVAPQRPGLDIEGIARRFSENRQAFEGARSAQATLRIFVTLAMPEASLKLLAAQAAKAHATIVIRGLKDDSMRVTLEVVRKLIGEHQVAWQIDPPAFTRFAIQRAPTFVLVANGPANGTTAAGCRSGCERPEMFVSVAGDVSLGYALAFIARTRPAFAGEAQRYLRQLNQ